MESLTKVLEDRRSRLGNTSDCSDHGYRHLSDYQTRSASVQKTRQGAEVHGEE